MSLENSVGKEAKIAAVKVDKRETICTFLKSIQHQSIVILTPNLLASMFLFVDASRKVKQLTIF